MRAWPPAGCLLSDQQGALPRAGVGGWTTGGWKGRLLFSVHGGCKEEKQALVLVQAFSILQP